LIIGGRCDAWLTIIRKTTDDPKIDDDYEKQLIDRRISLGVAKLRKGTIRILQILSEFNIYFNERMEMTKIAC
jgi:hypothetical protein